MKFLFIILLIAGVIYGSVADAKDIEYKDYIKAKPTEFMTFDNPSWTREEYKVKQAIDRAHGVMSVPPAKPILMSDNKKYIFNDPEAETGAFVETRSSYEQKVLRLNKPESYE